MNGRHLAFEDAFFAAEWLVGDASFGHQESTGRDAEAGVVVESAPAAPFTVARPEVLFQLLVVTLHAPALMGRTDLFHDGRVLRQRGQDGLAGLGLLLRPFNEQPFSSLDRTTADARFGRQCAAAPG